jgi:integrase
MEQKEEAGKPAEKKKRRTKPRAKSMGAVYQRKTDGFWCGAVRYPGGRRKVVYKKTKRQATAAVQEMLKEVAKQNPVVDESLTLENYLKLWLEAIGTTRAPRTLQFYTYIFKQHILGEPIAHKAIAKLTGLEVQNWINEKCQSVGPRVCEGIFQTLRAAFNRAIKWGMINTNPMASVEKRKQRRPERKIFSSADLERFLVHASGHPLWLLFQLAVGSGLRSGELLALQWEDIDFPGRSLTVRHTLQRLYGVVSLTEPKSQQSHRIVPLPDSLIDALRSHRLAQNEMRLEGTEWQAEPNLVFRTSTGKPIDARNVTRIFHQLQRQAAGWKPGKPKADFAVLNFHSLRHSAASLMLLTGASPKVASKVLGHSSISITMDLYSHVEQASERTALENVDQVIRRK